MKTLSTIIKKRFPVLIFLLFMQVGFAQIPQQLNYQGAVRDSKGAPLSNTQIGLRLSIQESGPNPLLFYSEERKVTTNLLGLYSVVIGDGSATKTVGDFALIPWGTGPRSLKVEVDINGGANFSLAGISPLVSVPYALYAKYAENGPAGPPGKDGATILSGPNDPPSGIGNPGDYYFNTTTNVLYGPQNADGTWPPGTVLLQGPAGPAGPAGADGLSAFEVWQQIPGNENKTLTEYLDGLKGDTGPAGPAGADGLSAFEVWQQIPGNENKTLTEYLDGLKGDTGPAGPAGSDGLSAFEVWQQIPGNENKTLTEYLDGLKGETGPTGPPGPSGIPNLTFNHILVGDINNVPQDVAVSGDAAIFSTGLLTINSGAVTNPKLADNSVTNNKIVNNAVTNEKINDLSITNSKIQDGQITIEKFANAGFVNANKVFATDNTGVPILSDVNIFGWSILGNNNINPNTHFIGTINNADLKFRVANTNAGFISSTTNLALGLSSAESIDIGMSGQNVFIGTRAGQQVTSASANTFIGHDAGQHINTSSSNTLIGTSTGFFLTNGSNNTLIGTAAGAGMATGNENVFIGSGANSNTDNLNKTIAIGSGSMVADGLKNAIAIGANAQVSSSNSFVMGGIGPNAVNVGIGTTAPSQKLHIKDGHIRSEQASPPAIALTFPNGFTGVTLQLGATDVRGVISLRGTSLDIVNYSIIRLDFNIPATNSPVVTITPANLVAAQADYYVEATPTGFLLYVKGRSAVLNEPIFNYILLE